MRLNASRPPTASSAGAPNDTAGSHGASAGRGETGDTVEAVPALQPRDFDLEGRAILLAMDGSAGAVAGARIALALATKHHALVHVLQVIDTRALLFPPALNMLAIDDSESHVQQANEVRASLGTTLGRLVDWPVRIILGTPSEEIVREAQAVDAALIIVGLRRHGGIDRALNNETALQVMRRASCPVLGVVPGTMELPVHVLAAIDFSAVSLLAARVARAVVGEDGILVLAYVPQFTALLADEGEKIVHELGTREAFKMAVRELGGDHVTLDHVVLQPEPQGTTAEMILRYADTARSDLIAAGSARHGRVERWMVGSVSTELVRDGRRSVLIVPPRSLARR